jgi:Xaa-Pro aminopeptidase
MDKTFQSYDDQSDASLTGPRLGALRAELKQRWLDGFIVPRADEHQGEYVPEHAQRLAWLTAFTGSAGAAVVLADKAAIFVDGRYTLQVREQTDAALFEPRDLVAEGPGPWIEVHAPKGGKIGYDPWLHTEAQVRSLKISAQKAGAELVPCETNPLDAVWEGQPEPPHAKAVVQGLALAGEESEAKRLRIAAAMQGAEALVLTMPDSISWLFNIRGGDVPHTPFALSFAILCRDGSADLFIDARKLSPELIQHLGNSVRLSAPDKFVAALDAMNDKTVAADPLTAAAAIFDRLKAAGAKIAAMADPCQLAKACKNPVEIEGMRKAHIRDGVALAKFFAWFSREAPKGYLDEISASMKLEEFRRETGVLKDLSFDTISAAAEHAAIPHYHVTKSSNLPVLPGRIYLVDSGAQYADGTTDVTRTAIVGEPSVDMKDRFTRVLKGHIALATAKFPEGTPGMALDTLARRPLWEVGLDFDHGTGHGVGCYLSVHEGPQNISKRPVLQALMPGMVVSNEPGYYKAGEYGIRIENLIVVREAEGLGERRMLEFETITLAPIDLNLVETDLLTDGEKGWLNAYHARVREVLEPMLEGKTRDWLNQATRAI